MKGTIQRQGQSWRWQHDAPPGWPTKNISGTCRLRKDAQLALAASPADHDRRVARQPDQQLAADYLREWLELRALKLKRSTLRAEADHMRLHIAPALAGVKVTEVTDLHVARIYKTMRAKGLSEKTVLPCTSSAARLSPTPAAASSSTHLTKYPARWPPRSRCGHGPLPSWLHFWPRSPTIAWRRCGPSPLPQPCDR